MNDFLKLLARLTSAELEFVVVGGTAAVLHGGSLATYDLDVFMPFSVENCRRLLAAVEGLHPRLSHTPDKRPLTLDPEALAQFKNLYLLTDLGRLDLLGQLPPVESVETVFSTAERMDVGGVEVRVIALDLLIQVKASLGRPKDKLMEAELRAIASARPKAPKPPGST